MHKYQKAALNIAFLTIMLSAGLRGRYVDVTSNDLDTDLSGDLRPGYAQNQQEELLSAFENNDYPAWRKLTAGKPSAPGIDESTFRRFVAARQAARQGQYGKAIKLTEKIKNELGIA
ncbi:MAG: hypothetical protein WC453_03180 [Patescibacteria group bacterium]